MDKREQHTTVFLRAGWGVQSGTDLGESVRALIRENLDDDMVRIMEVGARAYWDAGMTFDVGAPDLEYI